MGAMHFKLIGNSHTHTVTNAVKSRLKSLMYFNFNYT